METPPKKAKLPNPHESLLATAIMWLATIQQESQSYSLQCENAYNELVKLSANGLGNTVNASRLRPLANEYQAYLEAIRTIQFMREVWRVFGDNTIVMFPKHFRSVLSKQNLVCGRLRSFVGEIPPKALEEYFTASRNTPLCDSEKYCGHDRDEFHLPFIDEGGWYEDFYIAAPKECFVAAPKEELDPFIFSCSKLGYILIHAKWGAEAEDATIKRYEQLRDAIIGKGGEA